MLSIYPNLNEQFNNMFILYSNDWKLLITIIYIHYINFKNTTQQFFLTKASDYNYKYYVNFQITSYLRSPNAGPPTSGPFLKPLKYINMNINYSLLKKKKN